MEYDEKEFALKCVFNNGKNLQYFSNQIKEDEDVVLIAVSQTPSALQYASENLRNNYKVALTAIKSTKFYNYHFMEYFSNDIRNNKELMLLAVNNYGPSLEFISDELKNDNEVVLDALMNNPWSLIHASDRLQNDRAFLDIFINSAKEIDKTKPFYLTSLKKLTILNEQAWLEENTAIHHNKNTFKPRKF